MSLSDYLQQSVEVLQQTIRTLDPQRMETAIALIVEALRHDRPLLVFGNGGSASDAMHITGELVGRFLKERRGLNAVCLSSNPAVLTAWSNDYSYETVFSRQVEAYGRAGGVALGISTSGNSPNVIKAFEVAHAIGMTTVALTGAGGGKMAVCSDVLLDAPSRRTPLIQQAHVCLYHYLCQRVEEALTA